MKKLYDRGLALGTGKSTLAMSIELYGTTVKGHSYEDSIETHEEVAAKIFNVPVADVTPEQRASAKRARYMNLYHTPFKINSPKDCKKITVDFAKVEEKVLAWAEGAPT